MFNGPTYFARNFKKHSTDDTCHSQNVVIVLF